MPKRRLLKRTPSSSPDDSRQPPLKRRLRKGSLVAGRSDEELSGEERSSSSSSSSSDEDSFSGASNAAYHTPPAKRRRQGDGSPRRLSVSEVKGEFKLRKLASKRNDEPVSEDDSFLTDDDDFINDDTSEEDEEAAGGWTSGDESAPDVAVYHLIDEKMDEERRRQRQSAGLTVGAKIRSPEIAFYEYLEYLTVSLCEPTAQMNEKYAASVKRVEGELEQARAARSTTAWDYHGGLYRRGLDLYPDLLSRPTQTTEESTRLLRREEDRCFACNQRRWKLDARLNGRMCDSRRVWQGDIKYWYRCYGVAPLMSPKAEVGVIPIERSSSSDTSEDDDEVDENVEEVRRWMVDNWFHLGRVCRKNSEDYQFLQHYKERLVFRIYFKLKDACTITKTEMALAILNKDDKKWKQWKAALFEEYARVIDSAFNAAEYKRVRNEVMVDKFGKE
ncbi:hypothetical protein FOZ60_013507 [Perkinsus olseni]|uniref:DUF4211 domain-containing protein n=1 Tax=Perkinsus olseni TaxID=32597 RepID=A0A7J6P8B0_PEROL|nr:hypothetical protein FOZ60_013507 [Perkinsus olseni]